MNRTILQIPITKSMKEEAEIVANKFGFSSLQEILRVFIAKLAARKIDISFQEAAFLSAKSEKRYQKMIEDIQNERNIISTDGLKKLFGLME